MPPPPGFDPKAYESHEEERLNYKVTADGRILPNDWLLAKHANYAQPNLNTNTLTNVNLNASPYVNNNSNNIHDYEFDALSRKILGANARTPAETVRHWANQLKEYWRLSKLNSRTDFTDREKSVIQFVLNKPDEEIHLETLRSFVRAVVRPTLTKLKLKLKLKLKGGRGTKHTIKRRKHVKRKTHRRG